MTPTQREWRIYHEVKDLMRERFPLAFPPKGCPPNPLALGIGVDLIGHLLGEVKPWKVSLFLRIWTDLPRYHEVVATYVMRVGLDGEQTTVISEQHRDYALVALGRVGREAEAA